MSNEYKKSRIEYKKIKIHIWYSSIGVIHQWGGGGRGGEPVWRTGGAGSGVSQTKNIFSQIFSL